MGFWLTDLKPANVMVTTGGEVKLLDFGIARFVDHTVADLASAGESTAELPVPATQHGTEGRTPETAVAAPAGLASRSSVSIHWTAPVAVPQANPTQPSNRLTRVGTLMGTPLYMAPELWSGAAASPLSDVYALGLLLYELLAGKLPHAELELAELALFITSYDLPSLAEEMPALPRQLTTLIERCIRRDPSERPPTHVVRDELEALVAVYLPFFGSSGEQISSDASRVHASFLRVSRQGDVLARLFYERFFALEPALRELFPTDIGPQARMLTTALKLTIDSLQHPERLLAYLDELGRRHAHYGVQPRHLGLMGKALMEVLPSVDPEWTDSTAHAWASAYGHIAQLIQRGIENVRTSQQLPLGAVRRAFWEVPLFAPQTHWIQRPDGDLAFQSFGHGAIDIVIAWEWVSNLEQLWQGPRVATFLRHLASVARVTLFDRRGCGLSSASRGPTTLDQQVADMVTILDRAGIDRAVVMGLGDSCVPAALMAATRSERVRGLVLYGAGRCIAPGSRSAPRETDSAALLQQQLSTIRTDWGGPLFIDTLAPSLASDPAYRRWWSAFLRLSASPSEAAAMFQVAAGQNADPVLSALRVATLVMHRIDDPHREISDSRALAAQIRGAQLVELPGADHVPWAGDSDAVLSALHAFISSLPTSVSSGTLAGCVLAVTGAGTLISPDLLQLVRRNLVRYRAVTVDTPLDHTLVAYFDGPARAVQCALSITATAMAQGIAATAGLHIGQLTLVPTISGEAVEEAVALAGLAAPGEVLASDAVRTLTTGPDLEAGERLVGVAGEAARIVYTLRSSRAAHSPPS